MEIIREAHSNYLSHTHYKWGVKIAFVWPFICYLVSWYFWNIYPEHFQVSKELIFHQHEWWRLPFGVLVHGDFNHFLSNSLFLTVLSYFIARTYGLRVLFGVGFLMGVLTHFLTFSFMKDHISLVGASGMLYAFWGLWFSLYFLIDRFTPIHRKFMKIFAISLLLLIPQKFEPNVSYLAHFIGFIIGLISGCLIYFRKREKILSYEKYQYRIEPDFTMEDENGIAQEYWKLG